MSAPIATRLFWEDAFIDALAKLKIVSRAAEAAGMKPSSVYARRKRSTAFAKRWDDALEQKGLGAKKAKAGKVKPPKPNQWKRAFLEKLAETSNVTASAECAGISTREVYKARREKAEFAAQWQAALFEGYTNLEMEVLGYLRDPKADRKMDVASALRLLAAHKESAQKEKAVRKHLSAAELRASIARKVQALRDEVAAEETSGTE